MKTWTRLFKRYSRSSFSNWISRPPAEFPRAPGTAIRISLTLIATGRSFRMTMQFELRLTSHLGEEGVAGLVHVDAALERNYDLDLRGGIVLDPGNLDLAFLAGLEDRVDQAFGRGSERNLPDDDVLPLSISSTARTLTRGTGSSVLVVLDIDQPAAREVGEKGEALPTEPGLLRSSNSTKL